MKITFVFLSNKRGYAKGKIIHLRKSDRMTVFACLSPSITLKQKWLQWFITFKGVIHPKLALLLTWMSFQTCVTLFVHTMKVNGVQNNTGPRWLLLCGEKKKKRRKKNTWMLFKSSIEERKSYIFGTTWGWVNDYRIYFGVNYPFNDNCCIWSNLAHYLLFHCCTI